MSNPGRTSTMTSFFRYGINFGYIMVCAVIPGIAADNDREVFNRLYEEIIGYSAAGKGGSTDSPQRLKGGDPSDLLNATDSNVLIPEIGTFSETGSDRLQHEIEKMVDEIRQRHIDAVKFMQDK